MLYLKRDTVKRLRVSCQHSGPTVEEVERDSARHINGLREDGLPVPAPTSLIDYIEPWRIAP